MNHPELGICEIIGAEFLRSEFVYLSDERGFFDCEFGRGEICTRRKARSMISSLSGTLDQDEVYILAPAPTCEELGEWMLRHNDGTWNVADTLVACWLEANETQARAEAVKMILTNKGG